MEKRWERGWRYNVQENKLITIHHIRILGIELELACNGGSCGGLISLKIFASEKIAPHELRLQASSSSIPRIRNRPIAYIVRTESVFAPNDCIVLHEKYPAW